MSVHDLMVFNDNLLDLADLLINVCCPCKKDNRLCEASFGQTNCVCAPVCLSVCVCVCVCAYIYELAHHCRSLNHC